MSERQAKKLRQLYRKDLGKKAEAQEQFIKSKIQEQVEKLGEVMKPAPKWIPDFLWITLQKLFLNI